MQAICPLRAITLYTSESNTKALLEYQSPLELAQIRYPMTKKEHVSQRSATETCPDSEALSSLVGITSYLQYSAEPFGCSSHVRLETSDRASLRQYPAIAAWSCI